MEKHALLTTQEKSELVGGNGFWKTHAFPAAGIEEIRFADGPAGLRVQGKKNDCMGLNSSMEATAFPAHSALACSFDKELVRETAAKIGEEAAYYGVNVLLAPAINIKRNPLCGRGFEYFSEDEYLSGTLGREYISGVQSAGVGACVKHFAANNKEYGRTVSDSVIDERTLREIYLTPFEIAVKGASPRAVMTAYNRLNGVYCNENSPLIRGILRGEWGFNGIVISDWGGTNDRLAALKAGADLEMPQCKFSVDEIKEAIDSGGLSEDELDECVARITTVSEELNENKRKKTCDFEGHSAFAVKCAEQCAVLLKNENTLPLKGGEKFALVGDFVKNPVFQGGGSSRVNPAALTTLYGLAGDENCVGYARGFKGDKSSKKLIKQAVKLSKTADVVILTLGLTLGEAEGVDRRNLFLPQNQLELLNAIYSAGKRIIAVLSCGSAVDCSWDKKVSALLLAGLNGQGGAQAVANILKGKANPCGRLAETYPERLEDLPSTQYFGDSAYYTIYGEGMTGGYRSLRGAAVKYPFGFGLSYTSFEYSALSVNKSGATLTVKNVGGADGAEVVQLYVLFPEKANSPKRLKGFEKVFLRAGESREVFIPFDEFTFRSYDVIGGKWGIVGGQYEILAGGSAEDIRLSGQIYLEGDIGSAPAPDTKNLAPAEYVLNKNKRGRTVAAFDTPFSELKNSRAAGVRLMARTALKIAGRNPTAGGTLGFVTLRTCAQFAKFDYTRARGLVDVLNGKYARGVFKIIKGGNKK